MRKVYVPPCHALKGKDSSILDVNVTSIIWNDLVWSLTKIQCCNGQNLAYNLMDTRYLKTSSSLHPTRACFPWLTGELSINGQVHFCAMSHYINLAMDIDEPKERMLAIKNAKQKLREVASQEAAAIQTQFSELKKERLDNGYHFDVESLKKAVTNKMGVDASLLAPVVGWDTNDALLRLFDFYSGDSYETKRAKLDALERDHKIIVNFRDEHEQTYSKHVCLSNLFIRSFSFVHFHPSSHSCTHCNSYFRSLSPKLLILQTHLRTCLTKALDLLSRRT